MKKNYYLILCALLLSCTSKPVYTHQAQFIVKYYHIDAIDTVNFLFDVREGDEYTFEIMCDGNDVPSLYFHNGCSCGSKKIWLRHIGKVKCTKSGLNDT